MNKEYIPIVKEEDITREQYKELVEIEMKRCDSYEKEIKIKNEKNKRLIDYINCKCFEDEFENNKNALNVKNKITMIIEEV